MLQCSVVDGFNLIMYGKYIHVRKPFLLALRVTKRSERMHKF
jgi:hypothetical protein